MSDYWYPDDPRAALLTGSREPTWQTAPPRHRYDEPEEGCKSCKRLQYGCGDYVSRDMISWATEVAGYDLDAWQADSITETCGCKPDTKWACLESCIICNRQNGKGCEKLSNSIFTARGWTTFADIKPGDYVIGSDNRFTQVLATSPVFKGRDCYAVEFTDGAEIVVSQEHLWHVSYRGQDWQDVSTEDLIPRIGGRRPDNGRMEYNWRVRCDAVPELPEVDLPVDPYLLGYWLGDGHTHNARITIGTEDYSWVVERLYKAGARKPGSETEYLEGTLLPSATGHLRYNMQFRAIGEVSKTLIVAGLGNVKQIPEMYLTASVGQRKALLAGLMDSDGSINLNNRTPQCEFTTSIPELADTFHRLARSLGIRVKPTWRTTIGKDNCRFMFTAPFNPFEMPRKAARWRPPVSNRHELMSIVAIRPVESVPVRCIKVARPDGVYLTGELFTPTHNTVLEVRELSGLYLLSEPLIIHTAQQFSTSQEHMLRIVAAVTENPALSKRLKGSPKQSHGQESIQLTAKPAMIWGSDSRRVRKSVSPRLRFMARSRSAARGFTCDCLVYDEAMILSSAQVGASFPTMAARGITGNPQIWLTGSAGFEDSFELGRRHDRIVADTRDIAGREWAIEAHNDECERDRTNGRRSNYYITCPWHDDRDDPRSWAKANPALGIRISVGFLADEMAGMGEAEFDLEQLGVGRWPAAEEAWNVVSEDTWRSLTLEDPGDMKKPVAFAVDVPEGGQAATIAACWVRLNPDYDPEDPDSLREHYVIEVPRVEGLLCSRPGVDWVWDAFAYLRPKYRPAAIVIPRQGPGAALVGEAQRLWGTEDKTLMLAGSSDEAAAFALFTQLAGKEHRKIRHLGREKGAALWFAVGKGDKRKVGDGGWAWSRTDSTGDISPVTSGTLALWACDKKRRSYNLKNTIIGA